MKKRIAACFMALSVALSMAPSIPAVADDTTENAISEAQSNVSRIKTKEGGSYTKDSAVKIEIDDETSGHNGIIVQDAEYTISDSEITMNTDADGTDTCDFSGKGTAVAVFGGKANVTIKNTTRPPV